MSACLESVEDQSSESIFLAPHDSWAPVEGPRGVDPFSERLSWYLCAPNVLEAERRLDRLFKTLLIPELYHVAARVGLPPDLRPAIVSDASLSLLKVLRKKREVGECIRNFRGYLAVIIENALGQHLRRSAPRYYRLKSRIRYILESTAGLALRTVQQVCWAGEAPDFELGNKRDLGTGNWARAEGLTEAYGGGGVGADGLPPIRILRPAVWSFLQDAGGPLPLELLTRGVADRFGLRFHADTDEWDIEGTWGENHPQPSSVVATLENRRLLSALWEEIRCLPERQRAALLLNLRDPVGNSAPDLFLLAANVCPAEFRRVATAGISGVETLWGELVSRLPLADDEIGALLDLPRQQVINLRKSARARLTRRVRTLL